MTNSVVRLGGVQGWMKQQCLGDARALGDGKAQVVEKADASQSQSQSKYFKLLIRTQAQAQRVWCVWCWSLGITNF